MLLLFWILAAYGMTTIIVYGSIFESLRDWIISKSTFFGKLITCVLCTSTWVGFFFSLLFGGLANRYYQIPWYLALFADGMFTAGAVWMLNSIVEFFEENRIK